MGSAATWRGQGKHLLVCQSTRRQNNRYSPNRTMGNRVYEMRCQGPGEMAQCPEQRMICISCAIFKQARFLGIQQTEMKERDSKQEIVVCEIRPLRHPAESNKGDLESKNQLVGASPWPTKRVPGRTASFRWDIQWAIPATDIFMSGRSEGISGPPTVIKDIVFWFKYLLSFCPCGPGVFTL